MTDRKEQALLAAVLRTLHSGDRALLLPNVWDVASARIVEQCGFPAIATSSAGVAFSLGYPDGQQIRRDDMMAAVARITRAVRVPVTADAESGYGERPEDAALTARAVIEAGAVGMNLEDSTDDTLGPLMDLAQQVEKIHAVREAATEMKVPLVLNARTDVYLLEAGEPARRYDEAIRRLSAYRDAGADCVFVPGLQDLTTIRRLVSQLRCPVNILAGFGSPAVPELVKSGVARISLGSSPVRAALGQLRRIAEALKATGTFEALAGAPSHAEINRLLRRPQN